MFNSFSPMISFEYFFRFLNELNVLSPILNWFEKINIQPSMFFKIMQATDETLLMTIFSSFFGIILGLPLGILLFITRKNQIADSPVFHQFLSILVNVFRSIPFIILMVWMIPFTRILVGTSIGLKGAIVPLSIGISPFIARMVENALIEVPKGLIEAARSMGASNRQIITKVLIAEALPVLVNSTTIMLISLIGYSAMAGAIGAGGLGQLAYQYGYTMNRPAVMNTVIFLLIFIVLIIQSVGNKIVHILTKK